MGLKVKDNGWSLTRDGVTLRATFIMPAAVKITAAMKDVAIQSYKGAPSSYSFPLVMAEGADEYLVIITVGPESAAPPTITTTGKGNDLEVTVDQKKLRFNGTSLTWSTR